MEMPSSSQYDIKNDIKYAKEMIPHHQMAIEMSEKVIKTGLSGEIDKFARRVIEAQSKEIQFLRGWLKLNT
jgi:uncharacterized protein (DUF305 family)